MTGLVMISKGLGCREGGGKGGSRGAEDQNQLSLVAFLIATIRKSMVTCRVDRQEDVISAVHKMEIGLPTNVRHITHVTFDRFNGFLGLPVEFEVEIPGRVPSASASVFGVSAESMQCSYDSRGNSVPSILLLMQERLYSQGGLKAEGIFRINPENSQEEHVRDQLNRGIVPENIDVHCLAGLIKAWFRELPAGVLDELSPEEVLNCNTEEDCVELVKQLPPTQAALLNWVIDLMADVVEEEESNKMNARNIAMIFAPNMTQMSDPLTALMHAVQVMNLLKTLITKTLREREETAKGYSPFSSHSSDLQTDEDYDSQQEMDTICELKEPTSDYDDHTRHSDSRCDDFVHDQLNEIEECFLRQFDENEELTSDGTEKSAREPRREHISPSGCSCLNTQSDILFSDSKNGSSGLSTSDAEDSGTSDISMGETTSEQIPPKACKNSGDIDKWMEFPHGSSLPLLVSGESTN
ncbi:PREDICTED: rho GTPase-activating protein 2-like [Nelumbo nucifera]|uniref:Rho GTPase-activating protein 2-like n=1 Tax=Nelumbo nucifera TaxID=4432 RepID=A0A1U8BDV9_NELNU|nr:PREDICTED: rho GTPase-activating protein 2-like [Nelumbo nucifera]